MNTLGSIVTSNTTLERTIIQKKQEIIDEATRLYSKVNNVPVPNKIHGLVMNVYIEPLFLYIHKNIPQNGWDAAFKMVLDTKKSVLSEVTNFVKKLRNKQGGRHRL